MQRLFHIARAPLDGFLSGRLSFQSAGSTAGRRLLRGHPKHRRRPGQNVSAVCVANLVIVPFGVFDFPRDKPPLPAYNRLYG